MWPTRQILIYLEESFTKMMVTQRAARPNPFAEAAPDQTVGPHRTLPSVSREGEPADDTVTDNMWWQHPWRRPPPSPPQRTFAPQLTTVQRLAAATLAPPLVPATSFHDSFGSAHSDRHSARSATSSDGTVDSAKASTVASLSEFSGYLTRGGGRRGGAVHEHAPELLDDGASERDSVLSVRSGDRCSCDGEHGATPTAAPPDAATTKALAALELAQKTRGMRLVPTRRTPRFHLPTRPLTLCVEL